MSTPPPPQVPEGWLAKFDQNYRTFYYVNLATGKSQWDRPEMVGGPPQGPPPPPGPPQDANRNFGGGYGQPPPPNYGGYPPQQPGYGGGYPPQPPGYGYPPQGYGYPQQAPPPPQPQYVVQQAPAQKQSRMGGMGGVALGAGAGLLGGALLANAFDDTPDTVVENNYYDVDGSNNEITDYGDDYD